MTDDVIAPPTRKQAAMWALEDSSRSLEEKGRDGVGQGAEPHIISRMGELMLSPAHLVTSSPQGPAYNSSSTFKSQSSEVLIQVTHRHTDTHTHSGDFCFDL